MEKIFKITSSSEKKRSDKLGDKKIKRIFDVFGASLLIFLFSPLLVFLVVLIRKDGGASFYIQERIGYDGRKFKCYKFRSMVMDSQYILDELLKNSLEARQEWESDHKLKNDPRITAIGAYLRKTSLDELPQLFNVLKGDMSLVGPRPIVDEELVRYGCAKDKYYSARPGMTGVWQVSGRNDVSYADRVQMDSSYVDNWSLLTDIHLLIKTIGVVVNHKGAY